MFSDCGAITDLPTNGIVETPKGTLFGEKATYLCNKGYSLIGESTSFCIANGPTVVWNGTTPTCQIKGECFTCCD